MAPSYKTIFMRRGLESQPGVARDHREAAKRLEFRQATAQPLNTDFLDAGPSRSDASNDATLQRSTAGAIDGVFMRGGGHRAVTRGPTVSSADDM